MAEFVWCMRNGSGWRAEQAPGSSAHQRAGPRHQQAQQRGNQGGRIGDQECQLHAGCGQNVRMRGQGSWRRIAQGTAIDGTRAWCVLHGRSTTELRPQLTPNPSFLRQSLSECPSESLTYNPPVSALAEEGIEFRALCMLGKRVITELQSGISSPLQLFFFFKF